VAIAVIYRDFGAAWRIADATTWFVCASGSGCAPPQPPLFKSTAYATRVGRWWF